MLSNAQRKLLIGTAAVCALLMVFAGIAGTHTVYQPALAAGPLRFSAVAAMAYTRALAEHFPDRVTGTYASRRAAQFIGRSFASLGYRVTIQRFPLWAYGKRVDGQNVIAETAPASNRYVAVLAHYDSPTTTHQAAEDDASGVGTMLELARSVRGRRIHAIFIATDAEELGMIGARSAVAWLHRRGDVTALSVDYVNAGNARGLQLTSSGQFGGYTPIALRQIALAAAEQQTSAVFAPYGLSEWIDRAVERSFQDQGPLLEAKIPAINLTSVPADLAGARQRYHTPRDVYADFNPAVFTMVGRTAERTMLTLSNGVNDAAGDGFMISPTHYVSYDALWLILFLPLIPLIIAVVCVGLNIGVRPSDTKPRIVFEAVIAVLKPLFYLDIFIALFAIALAVLITPVLLLVVIPLTTATMLTPHKRRLLALTAPAFAAYVLIREFALYNVIPRFELYPPPPKDPFLSHPPASVILALLGILVIGYVLVGLRPAPLFAKGTLLSWSTALALAAFAINPFGFWLYLGMFTLAAALFVERSDARALTINLVMLALSALPFLMVLWYFAREIFVGGYVWWYLVLQAAYGTWSFWIVGAAIFATVLWVQYVRLALIGYASAQRAKPLTPAVTSSSLAG